MTRSSAWITTAGEPAGNTSLRCPGASDLSTAVAGQALCKHRALGVDHLDGRTRVELAVHAANAGGEQRLSCFERSACSRIDDHASLSDDGKGNPKLASRDPGLP